MRSLNTVKNKPKNGQVKTSDMLTMELEKDKLDEKILASLELRGMLKQSLDDPYRNVNNDFERRNKFMSIRAKSIALINKIRNNQAKQDIRQTYSELLDIKNEYVILRQDPILQQEAANIISAVVEEIKTDPELNTQLTAAVNTLNATTINEQKALYDISRNYDH